MGKERDRVESVGWDATRSKMGMSNALPLVLGYEIAHSRFSSSTMNPRLMKVVGDTTRMKDDEQMSRVPIGS
jgi:hypothetical protein